MKVPEYCSEGEGIRAVGKRGCEKVDLTAEDENEGRFYSEV